MIRKIFLSGLIAGLLAGCASSPKYKKSFLEIDQTALAAPLIDLEEFPTGRDLQGPGEHVRLRQALWEKLAGKFRVEPQTVLGEEMPEAVQREMRKLFVNLQSAKILGATEISRELKEYLQVKFENKNVLVAYYNGFQRSPKSMTSGYQSAAFKTELVPRAFAKDIDDSDFAHSPQGMAQGRYQMLPDTYGATLKIMVIQGSPREAVYFDAVHEVEDPRSWDVLSDLADKLAKNMQEVTGDHPRLSVKPAVRSR